MRSKWNMRILAGAIALSMAFPSAAWAAGNTGSSAEDLLRSLLSEDGALQGQLQEEAGKALNWIAAELENCYAKAPAGPAEEIERREQGDEDPFFLVITDEDEAALEQYCRNRLVEEKGENALGEEQFFIYSQAGIKKGGDHEKKQVGNYYLYTYARDGGDMRLVAEWDRFACVTIRTKEEGGSEISDFRELPVGSAEEIPDDVCAEFDITRKELHDARLGDDLFITLELEKYMSDHPEIEHMEYNGAMLTAGEMKKAYEDALDRFSELYAE